MISAALAARGAKVVEGWPRWTGWRHEFGSPTVRRTMKPVPREPGPRKATVGLNRHEPLTWLGQDFAKVRTMLEKDLKITNRVDEWILEEQGLVSKVSLEHKRAKGLEVRGFSLGAPAERPLAKLGTPTRRGDDWFRFDGSGVALRVGVARKKVCRFTLMDLASLPEHLR